MLVSGPGMQRGESSLVNGDASVVVDADVGVFVAAIGVRHSGEDEAHQIPVEARQVGVQVDRTTAGQRRDDAQDALLAAGQHADDVVVDRFVV